MSSMNMNVAIFLVASSLSSPQCQRTFEKIRMNISKNEFSMHTLKNRN